ncbi:MAG: hypothetical protein ACXAEI_12935, partial [Candidatus Hodarchaeales archaeon]
LLFLGMFLEKTEQLLESFRNHFRIHCDLTLSEFPPIRRMNLAKNIFFAPVLLALLAFLG